MKAFVTGIVAWARYGIQVSAAGLLVLVGVLMATVAVGGAEESRAAIGSVAVVLSLGGLFAWPRRPNSWRSDRPSDRQLEYAADLGIAVPAGATKGEVSDMISAVTGQ